MSSGRRLDWANQPDPFRTYDGAERIQLTREVPLPALNSFNAVLAARFGIRSPGAADTSQSGTELSLSFLSGLLFHSMAISAWKQIRGTDHKWALRVNPSSGNLHPTETHLFVNADCDLPAGTYHYSVEDHCLEQRRRGVGIAGELWAQLCDDHPPDVLILLSSIFWREAWKYEQRAFRYCQHDLGHAMAALTLSASAFGWQSRVAGYFPDAELAQFAGLAGSDEKPMLLIGLNRNGKTISGGSTSKETQSLSLINELHVGTPNELSHRIIQYPPIEDVYSATTMTEQQWCNLDAFSALIDCGIPEFIPVDSAAFVDMSWLPSDSQPDFSAVVRRRRSAVDMDGRRIMQKRDLAEILWWSSRAFESDFQRPERYGKPGHHLIHLFAYVHRVSDVAPGLYYYDRINCRLVELKRGDARTIAKFVSCFQEIAADGCFALSMVGDFNTAFRCHGERCYRYMHYEAGHIGQLLYLTADALGYDSTGIGCFVDDEVKEVFSLPGGFEVIYNFTVGQAVEDERLTNLSAYDFC